MTEPTLWAAIVLVCTTANDACMRTRVPNFQNRPACLLVANRIADWTQRPPGTFPPVQDCVEQESLEFPINGEKSDGR